MEALNLPKYQFHLKKRENQIFIFDKIRKKFVVCTPEEWVRQNLIEYFIQEKKVPQGLISVEKEISINTQSRRYDIMIASKSGKAMVLVECKAPNIKINQNVFMQIAEYNLHFKVPYLFVSNGLTHYFCKINENNSINFLKEMPNYQAL